MKGAFLTPQTPLSGWCRVILSYYDVLPMLGQRSLEYSFKITLSIAGTWGHNSTFASAGIALCFCRLGVVVASCLVCHGAHVSAARAHAIVRLESRQVHWRSSWMLN